MKPSGYKLIQNIMNDRNAKIQYMKFVNSTNKSGIIFINGIKYKVTKD